MIDFRCTQCNRLLAKVEGMGKVEIKCPRCKTMNLFTEEIYITIEAEAKGKEKTDQCTDLGIAEA